MEGLEGMEALLREYASRYPVPDGAVERMLERFHNLNVHLNSLDLTWNERVHILQIFKREMGLCAGIHPFK